MIAGTFVFEGLVMHFKLPDTQDGNVSVLVQDTLTGETAKVLCNPRAFAASMALALDFGGFDNMVGGSAGDGRSIQAALYDLAETIPFPNNHLRWIP